MPNISAKHTEFIRLVATGVNQQEAYILTSTNKNLTKRSARVEGSKLAKRYVLEIQSEKELSAGVVRDANNTNDAQIILKLIVDQAKADVKTFKVLSEDDLVDDIYMKDGKPVPYTRKPTQAEIQKSYELYCKRFGSFSATKIASTNKDGEDVLTIPHILILPASNSNDFEIMEGE